MKKQIFLLTGALLVIMLAGCKYYGYKKTDTGLRYKIHKDNGGRKAAIGDFMTLNMVCKMENDSILISSYERGEAKFNLEKPPFPGSLEEGFAMLGAGDSATFLVSADSLFSTLLKSELPPYLDPGSMMKLTVKMEKLQSPKEFEDEKFKIIADREQKEKDDIETYLKRSDLTGETSPSGLIYVELKKGEGPHPDSSATVVVTVEGKFLSGYVLTPAGKPYDLKLKNSPKGQKEGIAMMRKGGRAILVVPSKLAFGAEGFKNPTTGAFVIQPYTPIVFEVELFDIKK